MDPAPYPHRRWCDTARHDPDAGGCYSTVRSAGPVAVWLTDHPDGVAVHVADVKCTPAEVARLSGLIAAAFADAITDPVTAATR